MAKNDRDNPAFLLQFSLLLAAEAIFALTPLGSLPAIGPIVMTLSMIPVILTSLTLGTKAGSLMGAITGLISFFVWTFMPPSPAVAFIFTPFYTKAAFTGSWGSVLTCFVPRILVGAVTGLSYKLMSNLNHNYKILHYSISAILGSLTNTFLVIAGIYLFFAEQYAVISDSDLFFVFRLMILTNGIPEALICAVIIPIVYKPFVKVIGRLYNG